MLRQPQGELAIRTRAACNEVLYMLGDGGAIDVAAGLNFGGDIFRNGLRLKRVEGDNADRIVELSRQRDRR